MAIERGHADAAGVGAVNAKFAAQAQHLLFGQARVAEHADLLRHERHVLLHTGGLQAIDQFLAHGFDAHAHGAQLLFPLLAQGRGGEHLGHHRTAVGGRVGVVGADDDFQLREHAGGFFLVIGDHRQGPHALAVQAEAFAERGGDKNIQPGSNKFANHCAVFGNAMAKALVGHIEEGDQVVGLHHLNHLVPLRGGDVVAGGVVAAGVQHSDGARGGAAQALQHAVKVHPALGRVVVGVGINFKTGVLEDGAVVFPAGVRDQHLGIGVELVQKVGTDFQAAGAANGLHGGHAAAGYGLGIGAKHQGFDGVVVGSNPVDGQIATGCRGVHKGFFSRLYALQQGQFAVVVEVHAHAQIDFLRVGIGSVLFVQAQNGIARGHCDSGKQRHGSLSLRVEKKRAPPLGGKQGAARESPLFYVRMGCFCSLLRQRVALEGGPGRQM